MTKEVKIGLIGIAALAMLIFGINYLKGINMFQSANYYYVEYTNINGLAGSSPVFANGYKVGTVRNINYNYAKPGHVTVEVEVDKEMRIPKGSTGELVTEMLGTVKMNLLLNFNSTEYYQPGDTLPGKTNAGLMGAAEEKLVPQIEQMLPKMDSILYSLNKILADPALSATLHNAEKLTANLDVTTRQLNMLMQKDLPQLTGKLNTIADNFIAISDNLTELGIKRIRRVGHHTEFEQIKEYVKGDDYRTINWKASARRHELMVNVYQDERSQQIYNVIDKGRIMQQAFRGMTLLDYAINASLVLSYVVMRKEDKAGLVTFNEHFDTFIPASRQPGQMQALLENLYSQQTTFGETDFSSLCVHLNKRVNKRSLLVLYTNFSGIGSLNRQLAYLQQLNRQHRLLVIFFEDAALKEYVATPARDTEGYYRHVIAEKFVFEKRLIVSTLKQHGISSVLTTPENLLWT